VTSAVRVAAGSAAVAVLAATAAGCSSGHDAASRKAQLVATAEQAGSPTGSPTSNGAASTSSPPPARESAAVLDPDLAFRPDPRLVWREHPGAGPAPYENRDPAMARGSYRLQIRCLGGSVGIDVNGKRVSDVECAGSAPSIPICLSRPGLTVSAEWIRGPFTDLVWQLVSRPRARC
jgi:hypothetical protein